MGQTWGGVGFADIISDTLFGRGVEEREEREKKGLCVVVCPVAVAIGCLQIPLALCISSIVDLSKGYVLDLF